MNVPNTVIALPALTLPRVETTQTAETTVVGAMLILPMPMVLPVQDALILEMIHSTAETNMILLNAQLDGYATQLPDNAWLVNQVRDMDLLILVLLSVKRFHQNQRTDSNATFPTILVKNALRMICLAALTEVLPVEIAKTQPSNTNAIRLIQRTQNVTNVLNLEILDAKLTMPHATAVSNKKTNSHATTKP